MNALSLMKQLGFLSFFMRNRVDLYKIVYDSAHKFALHRLNWGLYQYSKGRSKRKGLFHFLVCNNPFSCYYSKTTETG